MIPVLIRLAVAFGRRLARARLAGAEGMLYRLTESEPYDYEEDA